MKITKQNYEEHALDYIEGTLSAEDRGAFERFLAGHPTIAEQVRALQADLPVLSPDCTVRFGEKASLKRQTPLRSLYVQIAAAAAVLLAGVLVFNALQPDIVDGTVAPLVADVVPTPVPRTIDRHPEAVTAPLVGPESPTLRPSVPLSPPPRNTRRQTLEIRPSDPAPSTSVEPKEEPARELALLTPLTAGVALKTLDQSTRPATERVVSVSRGYVDEQTNAPVLLADEGSGVREETNSAGFLNLLSPRGFSSFASRVIAPLSEISPVSVHENNEERVVRFASIPVSRRTSTQSEN